MSVSGRRRFFADPTNRRPAAGFARRTIAALASLVLVGSVAVAVALPVEATAAVGADTDVALSLAGSSAASTATTERIIPSSGSFTVQTWFKDTNTSNAWPVIVSQGTSSSNFRLQRNGNGTMHWQYGGFGSNYGWHVPANQWTHVSFTYNEAPSGNTVRIYLNGNLSYSWNAGSLRLQSVPTGFMVGGFSAEPNTTAYRLKGQVDETRVYSRALTQAEVRETMHTHGQIGDANPDASLIAYYDFNGEVAKRLTNKRKESLPQTNLSMTGTAAWENIATVNTVGTQNYVAFTRSYLTSGGGWAVPEGAATVDYIVVGAGGGGGGRHAGGGGGGAVLDSRAASVTGGETLKVIVGAAGPGGINTADGRNGQDSVIEGTALSATAPGGGGGGGAGRSGLVGASGGGGGASSGPGAAGTPGFGFAGGRGRFYRYDNGGENWHGGGGGGAGSAGAAPVGIGDWMRSGIGGNGRAVSWFTTTQAGALPVGKAEGTDVYFAGGGAGGKWGHGQAGRGGLGGGGNASGSAASVNSGSGGGAGAGGTGGYGGSGVVILSYSTVPNPVEKLVAKALTDTEVVITWDEPLINGASVHNYVVEWSKDNWATKDSAIITRAVGGGSQSYSLTGLSGATMYDFRVTATNPQSVSTVKVASARTWVKVDSSPPGGCIAYASGSGGVTVSPDGDSHCLVEFKQPGSIDWAVPPGTSSLDALVVGGGGAGGNQAGSGGYGGGVVDLDIGFGASRISQLAIEVGAGGSGGASPQAGGNSTLQGSDGTNTLTVTSPGGPAGKASNASPASPVAPTATKAGTLLTLTERKKLTTVAGGQGLAWTPYGLASSSGATGGTGWTPTWLSGPRSFGGGGGGGPVALTDVVLTSATLDAGAPATNDPLADEIPDKIVLTFSTDLSGTSISSSAFTVIGGSSSVASVSISEETATLTLNSANTGATAVSYQRPASDRLQSVSGVEVANFSGVSLGTSGTLAKTFVKTTSGSATHGGGASAASTVTTAGAFDELNSAKAGTANTGGGGGAGLYSGISDQDGGAAGGSGIVVVRYRLVNPPILVSSPEDLTITAGESATFTATFSSSVSEIRWQKSTTGGATWSDITGAKVVAASTSSYTVSDAMESLSGTRYRAVGKNVITTGNSFAETPTEPASLTVIPDPNTLPAGAFCDGRSSQNGLTTTAQHGRVFYIDSADGQNIDAVYVGYSVESQTARDDLWVEISDFTGGVVTLVDSGANEMPLGAVTSGGLGTAFFLLKASSATLTAQSHVVRVFSEKPSSGDVAPLYECGFSFSQVMETLPEPTNTVETITSTAVTSVGSTMTITVTGDTGTIGSGDMSEGRVFGLVPAARSSWPVSGLRLEKTELSMYSDAGRTTKLGDTHVNTLRLNDANGLDAAERQYWTAVYTFRVLGPVSSKAPIVPIAMVAHGTQIRHTDLVAAGSFPSPQQEIDLTPGTPASKLTVTKKVTSTIGDDGETVKYEVQVRDDGTTRIPYEITLVNSGLTEIVIDEILDAPDSQVTFVTGSAKYGETPEIPAPETEDYVSVEVPRADPAWNAETKSLAFSGPFVVPASSSMVLTYLVAIETCKVGESYTVENSAVARVGEVTIGSGPGGMSLVTVNANCGESEVSVFVDDVPLAPEVITGSSSLVTDTSATVGGLVDPNGQSGLALRFAYSDKPTLQSASFAALGSPTTDSVDPYAVSATLSGLVASKTYYYRLDVQVGSTWVEGEILSFTTTVPAGTPVATTTAVTSISSSPPQVTFTGTIDPNGVADGVTAAFEFGPQVAGTCPASGTKTASVGAAVTGSTAVVRSFDQTGLSPDVAYCVRIVGAHGTATATGNWVTFVIATKQAQSIWWSTGTKQLPAGGSTTVSAWAESGVAVSYTSVDSSACTVHPTSGLVTAVARAGSCSITAREDAGNADYSPAQPETITLTISVPKVTTAAVDSGRYKANYSQKLAATGGNGKYTSWRWTGDVPKGLQLSDDGVISGIPTVSGIYTVSVTTLSNGVRSEPHTLSIIVTKVPITVTAASFELTFGDAPPVVTPTFDESQFVSPDTASVVNAAGNIAPRCSTNYTFGTDAGDEYVFTRCESGWATNYSYSYISGAITVAPLPVTITALDAAKRQGTNDPAAFAYVVSPPLPSGQTMEDLVDGGAPTITREAGETPGSYVITPTGTVAQKAYEARKEDGSPGTETRYRTNYDLTFETGQLTITTKEVPLLTAADKETIFSDSLAGILEASATTSASASVAGSYRYSYVNRNGAVVTVTDGTRLPAGTYTLTVRFTPSDGTTFYGPVLTSLNLVVKPYQLTLTPLDNAKQNLLANGTLTVRPDPTLRYQLSPPVPSGQVLTDVFPNGVTLSRVGAGTAAGEYPESNATIMAKEGFGTYAISASVDSSPNYSVTVPSGATLTITEKKVPVVTATDTTLAPNISLGTRLNATVAHQGATVPGTLTYSYINADKQEVTVTSATALPLGLYSVRVTFTPANVNEYFGPVTGVMTITVATPTPSNNSGNGSTRRGRPPAPPTQNDPTMSPGPGGGTGGSETLSTTTPSSGAVPRDGFVPGSTSPIGQVTSSLREQDGFGKGMVPMGPGIGSLMRLAGGSPGAISSAGASGSGSGSGGEGSQAWDQMIATTTLDLGRGPVPLTTELATNLPSSLGDGQRTIRQLGAETFTGFIPGSQVRVEALGARTGARFALNRNTADDPESLIQAMASSRDTWQTDFFQIDGFGMGEAPVALESWTVEEQQAIAQFFGSAGLRPPASLASVNEASVTTWVSVKSRVSGYVPGSVVYLAVTSSPLVIGVAVVGDDGTALLNGVIPVEYLAPGDHRIRAVGIRSLNTVAVQTGGEIGVSDALLTDLEQFDSRTQATVALVGLNERNGNHLAMRVVSLAPAPPWWTLLLIAGVGLVVMVLRRQDALFTRERTALAVTVVVLSALPAAIFGVAAAAVGFVGIAVVVTALVSVGSWLVSPASHRH